MALIDGLVSYWKMDEASGTRNDAHSTNNLTANGTGGVGSAAGIISNAADFELSDSDYLNITDASQSGLDITGDISFSFWAKFEQLPSTAGSNPFQIILKGDRASGRAYNVQFHNNGADCLEVYYQKAGPTYVKGDRSTSAAVVSGDVGVWVHYAVTFNSTTGATVMYKNGSSVAVTNVVAFSSGALMNTTTDFLIGASQNSGTKDTFFDGLLDEVGIWSKVLTGAEVTELYNAGAGLAYPFSTSPVQVGNLMLLGVG